MPSLISQQLEIASERLRKAIASHGEVNVALQTLKSKFIGETNPVKKEAMKPKLIMMNKKERAAAAELALAEKAFQRVLENEPADVVDLLDHKLKEHYVRLLVRNRLQEQYKKK
jgi:predicted RNA-binding protein Jag